MTSVARFAWLVLGYVIVVILWGAYVRATGSGAGCGSHWPLCNGEVVPWAGDAATFVEYSHRLSSGLALLAVVALLVWTFRQHRPGHPARAGAVWSLVFMLTEAGVGAGIVLFELVADNASFARAMFMAVHLVNTFVLVAWLTLTAWWLSGGATLRLRDHARSAALACAAAGALLVVGVSGAVAALGDTLFPASSLAESLRADLSVTSHLLIRLRVLHPVLAVGGVLLLLTVLRRLSSEDARAAFLGRATGALAVLQLALGLLNVILLAPVWMQMVHLLVADLIWIGFVLTVASVVSRVPVRAGAHAAATLESALPPRATSTAGR